MKNPLYIGVCILLTIVTICRAQQLRAVPPPTPYIIVHREANERIWARTNYEATSAGKIIPKIQSYTEIANGLCYPLNGQWADSGEQISILPDGSAAATRGRHQAYFPADIYDGNPIAVTTPDGLRLKSRPVGLFYDDGTNLALIAPLTNSVGVLETKNQVIYPNAFSGIDADLRYTYRKGGFEQDVVLRQQLPPPEAFGLDPGASLEIVTEFFNAPEPGQSPQIAAGSGLSDVTLTFGAMKIVRGKAFTIGNSNTTSLQSKGVAVCKSWEHVGNRVFLVEALPYQQIAPNLAQIRTPSRAVVLRGAAVSKSSMARLLPLVRLPRVAAHRIQVAEASMPNQHGVVLDYNEVLGDETNFVFAGDTTYLVSGDLNLFGTTTIEGGTVVKFTTNSVYGITIYGPISCQTASYRAAIFTAIDDNSVGGAISGSTGNPSGYYAQSVLTYYAPDQITLGNIVVKYAATGVELFGGGINTVRDAQFIDVGLPLFTGDNQDNIENVLFYNDGTCLNDIGAIINGANLTADDCSQFWQRILPGYGSLNITNSLLIETGTSHGFSGAYNEIITNDAGIFQTAGAGSHYLAAGSPYRGTGTSEIDPALLADLAQKTTWPPIVYDATDISSIGSLAPQAPRDANSAPDLGYHYDSLDYLVAGCDLETNLIVMPGTAIGYFTDYDPNNGIPDTITLNDGANLSINGTATQPAIFAEYTMVQENGTINWYNDTDWASGAITFNGSGNPGLEPQLSANFSKWSSDGQGTFWRDYWASGAGNLRNSEFYNGSMSEYDMQYLDYTNCLFFRIQNDYWDQDYAISFVYEDCTFYNGCLAYGRYNCDPFCDGGLSTSFWQIENCSFDGTAFAWYDSLNENPSNTLINYNAYNIDNLSWQTYPYPYPPTFGTNEVVGPNDVMVTNYNWQTSWFGNFYLPPDSPLIEAGSTTANFLGLYYFTTQTNQVPEGNSIVDIGYHYVATDHYGNPLDEMGWSLTNEVVPMGGTAVFSVPVVSSCGGPFTYQWQFDGTNTIGGNTIVTLAGDGTAGYTGDGGPATNANLNYPSGIAVDDFGNVFITDQYNNVIREVSTNGTITTVAGNGTGGYSGDGGPATNAEIGGIYGPSDVCVDSSENLYIADPLNNVIRRVSADGIISTFAGGNGDGGYSGDGGPATNASLQFPTGVAVGSFGDLYIADYHNDVVRKVDTNGIITTVAGNGEYGYSGDGGPASNATFKYPISVAVDGGGNLYIADADSEVIRKVSADGIITTVAGDGTNGYAGDGGPATNAMLDGLGYVALDSRGDLYIADSANNVIRKVDTNGIISTIVGNGASGYSGDGGLAINASLNGPQGVAVDAAGNIDIGDTGNNVIRQAHLGSTNIQGGTLILSNVTTNDAGTYEVTISSPCGTVTASATLTVTGPPYIVMQPVSQTVVQGTNGEFSIAAAGATPMYYQWYFNGSPLPGAVYSTLVLTNIQASGAGNYNVVVSNILGSVASSNAVLTVLTQPVILLQPQGTTVDIGQNAYFTVEAIGGELNFQWESNGVPIAGATNSTYILENVQASDNGGNYSVAIENLAGSTNSISAPLTVFGAVAPAGLVGWWQAESNTLDATGFNPPGIVEGQNLSYIPGEVGLAFNFGGNTDVRIVASTNLDVGGDGNGLTIEGWIYPDFTNGEYSIAESDAGLSNAVVGLCGSANTNGDLLAYFVDTNGNSYQIATSQGVITSNAYYHVAVTYDPSSGLASLYCNGSLVATNELGTFTPQLCQDFYIGYSASRNLNYFGGVDELSVYDRALSSNEIAEIYNDAQLGKHQIAPTIVTQPAGQTVNVGNNATFSVTATGASPLSYQWETNGVAIPGATASTYVESNAQIANNGESFTVIVQNSAGRAVSSAAILTVNGAPVITVAPANQNALYGASVTFNVTATGTGLSYQWSKNGTQLSGQTSPSLTISSVQLTDAGSYSVKVSNAAGSAGASASLLVLELVSTSPNLVFTLSGVTSDEQYDLYLTPNATGENHSFRLYYRGDFGQSSFTCPPPNSSFGNSVFFRAALASDTDGDGLSDGYERLVSLTSTTNPKTDGQLQDGWEAMWGVAPYSEGSDLDNGGDDVLQDYQKMLDPWVTGVGRPIVTLSEANGSYTFTRTGSTSSQLVVNYTVGGTAVYGQDYTLNPPPPNSTYPFSITIPAGSASVTLSPQNPVPVGKSLIVAVVPFSLYDLPAANWTYVTATYSLFSDTDGDGLADGLELSFGCNPDIFDDVNGDGIPDWREDSNGGGLPDSYQRLVGLDPTKPLSVPSLPGYSMVPVQ